MADHVDRFLTWDGVYSIAGGCTRAALEPAANLAALKPPLTRSRAKKTKVRVQRGIGVRIVSCDTQLWPGVESAAIEVRLKRPNRIRSLMLRIYANATTTVAPPRYAHLVYQELLDQPAIGRLPQTDPTRNGGAKALRTPTQATLDSLAIGSGARRGDGPYRVVVWVSRLPNAFAAFATNTPLPATLDGHVMTPNNPFGGYVAHDDPAHLDPRDPAGIYGTTVHDTLLGSAADATAKGPTAVARRNNKLALPEFTQAAAGRNLINVTGTALPGIQPLVFSPFTGANAAGGRFTAVGLAAGGEDPAHRGAWAESRLTAAIAHAGVAPPSRLRVFVMPEWYFRGAGGVALTLAQKNDAVQELQDLSNHHRGIVIVGGSIYWGAPRPDGRLGVKNTGVVCADGNVLLQWDKACEADLMLGERVDAGKTNDVWQAHEAMGPLGPGIQRAALQDPVVLAAAQPPQVLVYRGVSFGFDICADHGGRIGMLRYAAAYPMGRGVDVYILVSASISITGTNNYARRGGLLIHCDGNSHDDAGNKKVGHAVGRVIGRDLSIAASGVVEVNRNPDIEIAIPPPAGRLAQKAFAGNDTRDERVAVFQPWTL